MLRSSTKPSRRPWRLVLVCAMCVAAVAYAVFTRTSDESQRRAALLALMTPPADPLAVLRERQQQLWTSRVEVAAAKPDVYYMDERIRSFWQAADLTDEQFGTIVRIVAGDYWVGTPAGIEQTPGKAAEYVARFETMRYAASRLGIGHFSPQREEELSRAFEQAISEPDAGIRMAVITSLNYHPLLLTERWASRFREIGEHDDDTVVRNMARNSLRRVERVAGR